jgi:hypothetical protein
VTLPLALDLVGYLDRHDVMWTIGTLAEVNPLLRARHYLGPVNSGGANTLCRRPAGRR